ncbi:homolog to cytochrome c-type biogenesis protein CcdA (plasmid) [Natrialba magadii ATCC 43099]|uniref:Cytochrome c biogenesis protein transmembrane region n=1 Tax=Natrialba magadii (strain ATCC 43099 / DSM 3394 / CCM 3739 / CIP 104546 / IAM 13178 / JCM 8861 / NBRC 102185 / NCIMB 2190 / MS3) TaxID=547559 RepID=D3T0Z1_NATMM|nr:cytochrome c biogenesis protein CcdA [Natrialba magadii]ADD07250.1 homolog to cytochrome c-type biogenesis protein CcdA [Natrialba magadii ATCC 43099]ELY34360.1 cytochrome c biogenesis protein transmembrane region [Natrialba magadii ATCC 43099]
MTELSLLSSVAFALTAGVATFFSPCAYPLLPGYVGFYVSRADGNNASLGGSTMRGIVAGVGVLGTLTALLGVTFWLGHSTVSRLTIFESLVGALLIGFGLLVLADRAPSLSIPLPKRRSGVLGFGIFGAGYALAGAGCAAPVFLAVVARALSLPADAAAVVLVTYVGSVAPLMLAITVATGVGLLTSAGRFAAYSGHLKKLAGAVMVVAGIGQLYLALVVY